MKGADLDEIYRQTPLEQIPWHIVKPPGVLVELVESGAIYPCKVIDFGCGTGNHAVYLAGKGFDVTGVDLSETAIRVAENSAARNNVRCTFVAADVLGSLDDVPENFDFAYDWELLHHIFPEERERYVGNVYRRLKEGGRYLSVCFGEQNTNFGGRGKYRRTPLGTTLYFSSEVEMRNLFEPYFEVIDLRTIQIQGKSTSHHVIYAFMEKPS